MKIPEKLNIIRETIERERNLRIQGYGTLGQSNQVIEDKINEIIDYLANNKKKGQE